jgi:hypothetical protein
LFIFSSCDPWREHACTLGCSRMACTAPHMCRRMVPAEVAISPSRWSQRQHGCVVYPSRSPTVGRSICICSAYASRQHRRVYMMLSPTVGPSHKLRNKIVLVKVKLTSIARALHVPFERILCARSVGAPMSKINPDHTLHIQRYCVRGFCKMFFATLYILQKPP